MKQIPKADADINKLFEMVYLPVYTKVLFAGIELDIFSELEEAKNDIEIAEKLNLDLKNTRYLLDALTAIELLEKQAGFYKNTVLASKYLVTGHDLFIGEHLRAYSKFSGFDTINIVKMVKEGAVSEYEGKQGLEGYELYGDYNGMVRNLQRAGRANEIAELVALLPEFHGFKKMLDLGGGPGLIGMAVIQAHPVMNGVIFESPAVGKIAAESIKEYHMEDRVEVVTGDYMTDSIGEGYDFILAIGTLNFAKQDLDTIIRKIYDALNPQGVFMCISEGLTHERTRPKEMIISWLPSFLSGCDFSLEQGEISNAIIRNGFKSVYNRTIKLIMGEMDVDIARK